MVVIGMVIIFFLSVYLDIRHFEHFSCKQFSEKRGAGQFIGFWQYENPKINGFFSSLTYHYEF